MAWVFKNLCPSVQDKFVLLRLNKKGISTQLSTWQLAPFKHWQVKPLDQGRKKKYHLHPGVGFVEKFLADRINIISTAQWAVL